MFRFQQQRVGYMRYLLYLCKKYPVTGFYFTKTVVVLVCPVKIKILPAPLRK